MSRMKFDLVLKQLKLNTLLFLIEILINIEISAVLQGCVKKNVTYSCIESFMNPFDSDLV